MSNPLFTVRGNEGVLIMVRAAYTRNILCLREGFGEFAIYEKMVL